MLRRRVISHASGIMFVLLAIACAPVDGSNVHHATNQTTIAGAPVSSDRAGSSGEKSAEYGKMLHRYASPPEGKYIVEAEAGFPVEVSMKDIFLLAGFAADRERQNGRPSSIAEKYINVFRAYEQLPYDSLEFWVRAQLYESFMVQERLQEQIKVLETAR